MKSGLAFIAFCTALLLLIVMCAGCSLHTAEFQGISQQTDMALQPTPTGMCYILGGHLTNNSVKVLQITGYVVHVNGQQVQPMCAFVPSIIQPQSKLPYRIMTAPINDIDGTDSFNIQFLWKPVPVAQ